MCSAASSPAAHALRRYDVTRGGSWWAGEKMLVVLAVTRAKVSEVYEAAFSRNSLVDVGPGLAEGRQVD